MTWNVSKIMKSFGGPNGVHAALKSRGYDLSIRAVKQWQRRGTIPADWIAKLILLAPKGENPLDWIAEGEPVPEVEDIF